MGLDDADEGTDFLDGIHPPSSDYGGTGRINGLRGNSSTSWQNPAHYLNSFFAPEKIASHIV
jgi:hypothetical protein